jgi:hypothetical protein
MTLVATDAEVFQCLHLLLKFISGATLLFDRVDECSDTDSFLTTIQQLSSDTGVKVLLLGRPHINVSDLSGHCNIDLEPWQNVNDIKIYLQLKIGHLHRNQLLPKGSDCDEVSITLACRAQGMFLWARLVVQHLSNKSLSPRERRDVIFDAEMLDGIDGLYDKILGTLIITSLLQRPRSIACFRLWLSHRCHFYCQS